jgi:hypothetical protein
MEKNIQVNMKLVLIKYCHPDPGQKPLNMARWLYPHALSGLDEINSYEIRWFKPMTLLLWQP